MVSPELTILQVPLLLLSFLTVQAAGCSSGERPPNEVAFVLPGSLVEAYREHAIRQGLRVYPTLDAVQPAEKEQFDLISMAHVLEHLPDPVRYLGRLRQEFLAPGGWLLIEVPNLYAHDSFEVAHLSAFSPHTLRQALVQAGWKITALRKHGQPRSKMLPLYLTTLARREENRPPTAPRPERNVALKRKGGMLRRRIMQRAFPKFAWQPMET